MYITLNYFCTIYFVYYYYVVVVVTVSFQV